MLGLQREYRVAEIDVNGERWLTNETPREIDLAAEGVLLLVTRPGGTYIGAPGSDTEIRRGDTVVLYGKAGRLRKLATRDASDDATHEDAPKRTRRSSTHGVGVSRNNYAMVGIR